MAKATQEDPYTLLQEWLNFWEDSDLPPKPPKSLHTRTAVALVVNKYEGIKADDKCVRCGMSRTKAKGLTCVTADAMYERHRWTI